MPYLHLPTSADYIRSFSPHFTIWHIRILPEAGTVATYEFQPLAVETHRPLSISSVSFLVDLGRKISEHTGEPLKVQFLFQRISVLIQRFNSVLFHHTFPVEDDTDK